MSGPTWRERPRAQRWLRRILYGSVVGALLTFMSPSLLGISPLVDELLAAFYGLLVNLAALGFFGAILGRAALGLVEYRASAAELLAVVALVVGVVLGLFRYFNRVGLSGSADSFEAWLLAGWGGVAALCGAAWSVRARARLDERRPAHRALLMAHGLALPFFLVLFVPPLGACEVVLSLSYFGTAARCAFIVGLAVVFALGIRAFVLEVRCRRPRLDRAIP